MVRSSPENRGEALLTCIGVYLTHKEKVIEDLLEFVGKL